MSRKFLIAGSAGGAPDARPGRAEARELGHDARFSAPDRRELDEGVVHVWTLETALRTEIPGEAACSAPLAGQGPVGGSRGRGRRIVRSQLANILSTYAEPDGVWRFDVDSLGRPFAANAGCDLDFNISHADGLSVVAVAKGGRVGVDIEAPMIGVNPERLAPLVLSDREQAAMAQKGEAGKSDLFYMGWTLKEAYAKARGLGLRLSFQSLEFMFPDDGAIDANRRTASGGRWAFEVWRLGTGHTVAVARSPAHASGFEARIRRWRGRKPEPALRLASSRFGRDR